MPSLPTTFALLEDELADYETAQAVVWPVPYERTTSYGKGTAGGPEAIIRASCYLETYDEELECEPADHGLCTLPPFLPEAFDLDAAMDEIAAEASVHLEAGKFLITLGGEHGLSLGPIRAVRAAFGQVGVVQFDAHADLRQSYEGTPFSHACIMRRADDLGLPSLSVGIRSLSEPEAVLIREQGRRVIWGMELEDAEARFDAWLDALPAQVYLTFDVDYFDPSLVPATGTPEPGGGHWYPTLRMLRRLFARKHVVAMDVVELAPIGGQPASDFLTAKLVYKCLGYRFAAGAVFS